MALRTVISSRMPMVIILGATGTGKTKLGIELAQKFGTEIISADSMQIYKGLDVVTAKATRQERELVRHHLVDILEPHEMFTVVDFRDRTLEIIDNMISRGKMPIIVGGTNYYLESIVYKILVEKMEDTNSLLWDKSRRKRELDEHDKLNDDHDAKKMITTKDVQQSTSVKDKNPETSTAENTSKSVDESTDKAREIAEIGKYILEEKKLGVSKESLEEDMNNETKFTNEEIHAKLQAIDPVMAQRLHPNNRRKVLRSIEVWLKTGRCHSEILEEQKLTEGQLRRPGATIMLWLKCDQQVHAEWLDARVDSMLEEGLIAELMDFHARHNQQRLLDGKPTDYTKGIFQTLGLKEFHDYLMLSEEKKQSDEGKKLLASSIENMKIATKRFARRQNKMVRGRFLEHPNREVPPIYELDITNISAWDEQVKNKAIKIIESYLNNTPCEYKPIESVKNENNLNDKSCNYCEVCSRLIIGDKEYSIHLNSNRHMKVLKKKKKLEEEQMKKEQT